MVGGSSFTCPSSRAQRNTKEKNRRKHMKHLISQLGSLIPSNSKLSMPEILDEATSYIMNLQKKKESLEEKRANLKGDDQDDEKAEGSTSSSLPRMNIITTSDSTLELNLICGSDRRNFMLHEIIRALEDEAAQVVNVTQTIHGDQVIFTIKSQAINPRIGMETSRVEARLEELILRNNTAVMDVMI